MAHLPKGQGVVPMPPFLGWLSSNIPAVYDNTMSYYEELTSLIKYLQDTVVPALNADSEAITVLSNFVEHYFDNLDVQEEINNKLDQMAEDGTLQEIITTYIQANVAWTFETVADMKLATNLIAGSYAKTLGFHTVNDGGGAIYHITDTATANEQDIIAVGSLFAVLVKSTIVTPQLYGAYGDGTHDDTLAIQRCMTVNSSIVMDKTYLITAELTYNGAIDGLGSGVIKTNTAARITGGFIKSSTKLSVKNLNFDCASNVTFTLDDKFADYNVGIIANGELIVSGCEFHNLYEKFIKIKENTVSYVDIHDNLFSSDNKTNVYMAECIAISSVVNPECIINISHNTLVGYEYTYVGTYDNDYNINACGLEMSNVVVKNINVDGNVFEHLGRLGSVSGNVGLSRLYPIDCYFNVKPFNLTNNKIVNSHWGGLRLHGCTDAFIDNNLFTTARACTEPLILVSDSYNSSGAAPVGCDNVTFSNNKFYNKSNVYEYLLFVNSYTTASTSGGEAGFHGHVDNFKFINNEIEFCSKRIIAFDYSLKTAQISNNTITGDFSSVSSFNQGQCICVDDRAVMGTATYGKTFANTKIEINHNYIIWKGPVIYTRTTDSSLTTIFSELTADIEKNIFKYLGPAYAIYGMPDASITAISNLIKSNTSGTFNVKKMYNNIVFYAGTGVNIYGATTSEGNSTYTN